MNVCLSLSFSPCLLCGGAVQLSGTSSRPQASRLQLVVNERNRSGHIWWSWPCCQLIFIWRVCVGVCLRVSDNRCRPDLDALTKYKLCCANTGDFHLERQTQTHTHIHPQFFLLFSIQKQDLNDSLITLDYLESLNFHSLHWVPHWSIINHCLWADNVKPVWQTNKETPVTYSPQSNDLLISSIHTHPVDGLSDGILFLSGCQQA